MYPRCFDGRPTVTLQIAAIGHAQLPVEAVIHCPGGPDESGKQMAG
ncbi:hypothetical protein PSYPI_02772, partial [Pseudomonas syringae pv. pisi str. 1704B]